MTSFIKIAQIFFGPALPDRRQVNPGQWIAVGALSLACLAIPWIYEPLWAGFGVQLPHISLFTPQKLLILCLQGALGIGLVRWLTLKEPKMVRNIRHFQIGFGVSNGLMLFFLLLMIAAADLI